MDIHDCDVTPRGVHSTGHECCGYEFYQYVTGIFRREGLSALDAQDQTQETYLRAIKRQRSGGVWPDTAEAMKLLLGVIARSVHKDFCRKQNGRGKKKRARVLPFASLYKEKDSAAHDPLESKAFVRKTDEIARMTWLELIEIRGGAHVVDTVKLVEQGHTQKECAELLGVNVRTVGKSILLARVIVDTALSA